MRPTTLLIGVLVICSAIAFFPSAAGETFGQNMLVNNDQSSFGKNVPAIAIGWDGTVYAAWQDQASGAWRIMLAQAPGSGGMFMSHTTLAPSVPPRSIQQSPDIGFWNDTVYVVWQDNRSGPGIYDIFFTSVPMPAGVPRPEKKINSETWNGSRIAPAMAIGPNGSIFVAYGNGTMDIDEIRLIASYDRGETWTPSTLVSDSRVNTRGEQRVAVDPYGKVYVVWRDGRSGMIDRPGGVQVEDDDVYMANSTDGGSTFGPDAPVNDVITGKVQSSPSIAIDGYGCVHIAWKDERLQTNQQTDIFYAKSLDGRNFGPNIPVNDSAPVVMTPSQTNHQQAWIAVDPPGRTIYVTWVDSRAKVGSNDPNHNVYIAKSIDGGKSFHPANIKSSGANVFFDDVGSFNGVFDTGEAALLDNGNGYLDPGLLNGSPDRVTDQGRANLQQDLTGTYLRFHDTNTDGTWQATEDIFLESLPGATVIVEPNVLASWDNSGYTEAQMSFLHLLDQKPMNISAGRILAIGGFNTLKAELNPGDDISMADLYLTYRANSTYTGTAPVKWSLELGTNQTWITPTDTSDFWTGYSKDLYSLGITNVTDLRDMNVSFVNNGAGNVSFDQIILRVSKGLPGIYDNLDTLVYDGATMTTLGDTLLNFTATDRIVYMDVNMTGRYDRGDPIIHTSAITGTGGVLTSQDEVLTRADGPRWKSLFYAFPVNNDPPGNNHYMTRLALNPFDHITIVWQDWRRGTSDIYSATTATDSTLGPWMNFHMDADETRARPGGLVYYSMNVTNVGGVAAANVVVKNNFAPGLEFVRSNPDPDQLIGGVPEWQIPFVSSFGSQEIRVELRVNASVAMGTQLPITGVLNFTDILHNPRPEMYAWLTFTASDLQPPSLVHTPITTVEAGGDLTFTATATDNIGVSEVRLYIKPVGATFFNNPITMDHVVGTDDYRIVYRVGADAGTLEYYIDAVDTSGNVATLPLGAPSQAYQVTVTAPPFSELWVLAAIFLIIAIIVIVIVYLIIRGRRRALKPEGDVHEEVEEEIEMIEEEIDEPKEPPPE